MNPEATSMARRRPARIARSLWGAASLLAGASLWLQQEAADP